MNKIMDVLDNIDYGYKDSNGLNILNDEEKWEKEFSLFYHLLSPDELLKLKCGVCWDQVELERKLFKDEGIDTSTYFIYIDDKNYLPSHTFLVYNDNGMFCWFEHSWYDYKGVFKYNSLDELMRDVKDKFVYSKRDEISGTFKLNIYKYNCPKYGISCDEFYEFIYTQELVYSEEVTVGI